MGSVILKGSVKYDESDIEYIWHSSDGACEKCRALNGKVFSSINEIPDPLHPNCKCWVEEKETSKVIESEEVCDCWKFFEEIDEIIGDAKTLKDEAQAHQDDTISFMNNLNTQVGSLVENFIVALKENYQKIDSFIKALNFFIDNYFQLLKNGPSYDKYHHSKANCEAAQLGIYGEQAAKKLSDAKEKFDIYAKGLMQAIKTKNKYKDIILKKIIDSEDDQKANEEGRRVGRENPDGICGEMLDYKIPKEDLR